VSALDLDAQGLFLHFCMKAWSEQGAFNICSTSVRLRFRKPVDWVTETVAAMVEVGILVEDGDKHRIKFIDDQLESLNELREKKSNAGKKSALVRAASREEKDKIEEESIQEKSSVLNCVQHVFNTCSPPVKPKTFKQWTYEDLLESVKEHNTDGLLTDEQAADFAMFWTDEKDASGKPKLHKQKTWSTRMRMKTAKQMIYDKPNGTTGGNYTRPASPARNTAKLPSTDENKEAWKMV